MSRQLASIDPKAEIGSNVTIEPFTTIFDDVVIGDGCRIGPNVTVYPGARIGSNVQIFPGAVISSIPQDLKYDGEETTVEIGDNTIVRECVTIHKGTKDKMHTIVGSNCLLMAYVHVAHDCIIGNNCILASYSGLSGHNVLEDWVIMEGRVGTQQFIRIGAHAFIAGASGVRKNVPPFVRAAREPLVYSGINSVGLKRRGFSEQRIREIEDIYRVIYVKNNNMTNALKQLEDEFEDTPEKRQIIDFIQSSERGVMKGS